MKDTNLFKFYHNPPRMPRNSKYTKIEIKTIYEHDESLYWNSITTEHNSLSGFIRNRLSITRIKIKKCHKMIQDNKKAQIFLNKWITGNLFKAYDNSKPTIPECRRCPGQENSLLHFMNCSGLNLMSIKDSKHPKKWKQLCIKLSKQSKQNNTK
jgi:hypothetical protein